MVAIYGAEPTYLYGDRLSVIFICLYGGLNPVDHANKGEKIVGYPVNAEC